MIMSKEGLIFDFSVLFSVMACSANNPSPKDASSVYDFTVNDIKGAEVSLSKYRGHPLIIVNVASKCGYTDRHYKELNELHAELAESKGKFVFHVYVNFPIHLLNILYSKFKYHTSVDIRQIVCNQNQRIWCTWNVYNRIEKRMCKHRLKCFIRVYLLFTQRLNGIERVNALHVRLIAIYRRWMH